MFRFLWALFPLVLLLTAESAIAACSRADVDHFLNRGFTPEQVVLLCGGSADDSETPLVQESTETERELRDLLLRSVDAKRVDLDERELSWRQESCAEFAADNLAGRPRERCGEVVYRIAREELEIGEIRERVLIFGEHGVEIQGLIHCEWDMDLSGLSKADRRRLAENTPSETRSALLPLHPSATPEEISRALERWRDARDSTVKP